MKKRKSFFIRWLLITDDDLQPERSVIEVEHIQSGCNQRVSSLEEANQWMQDARDEQEENHDIEIKYK